MQFRRVKKQHNGRTSKKIRAFKEAVWAADLAIRFRRLKKIDLPKRKSLRIYSANTSTLNGYICKWL